MLLYDFSYDYVKPKYCEKAKLRYMDTDNFFLLLTLIFIHKDIVEDAKTRFDTSNYELDRLLPKGKNKKVIGLIKDELGGKVMTKFVALRAKIYIYLIDGGSEDKKAQKRVS